MSETTTTADPQPNVPSIDPPAPAPDPAPAPAPEAAASPEPPVEQTEEEKAEAQEREREQKARGDRRFATLTAKLAAAERVQTQQAAELEFWRRSQAQPQPGQPPTPEQQQEQLRAQIRSEESAKVRAEMFHTAGRDAFPDWQTRCDDLVAMGADANFAQLLIEMPGGVQVAAVLAGDPEEVQRIANIRSERGRAVEIGKYAASIPRNGTGNGAAAAARVPPVTRAPAPVRPVTGRASPAFNPYTASAQELADYYFKENLERQKRH